MTTVDPYNFEGVDPDTETADPFWEEWGAYLDDHQDEIRGGGTKTLTVKYSEDQPRADNGRFGEGSSGARVGGQAGFVAQPWQTAQPALFTPEWIANREAGKTWVDEHVHGDRGGPAQGSYTAGSSGINGALRNGDAPPAFMAEIGPVVAGLDKAIAGSTVDVNTVAYRGQDPQFLDGRKVGDTFVDHGYVSTSLMSHWAATFGDPHSAGNTIEVHIPAGAHALPGDGAEHELVLGRDSTYRVDAVGDHPVISQIDMAP